MRYGNFKPSYYCLSRDGAKASSGFLVTPNPSSAITKLSYLLLKSTSIEILV